MAEYIAILLELYRHNAIILSVRWKEVVKLDDRIWDVGLALIGAVLAKAVDVAWESRRRKTPRRAGKHFPRS